MVLGHWGGFNVKFQFLLDNDDEGGDDDDRNHQHKTISLQVQKHTNHSNQQLYIETAHHICSALYKAVTNTCYVRPDVHTSHAESIGFCLVF